MIGDDDPALEELKRAVALLVVGRADETVSASRTGDGTRECLALTVEPETGPCRYLRIHSTDAPEPEWRYAWLWSAYRGERDYVDNSDGRRFGDLERTLDAVQHWILDGMRWQDVPEFALPDSQR
jgi:hypothetical protein